MKLQVQIDIGKLAPAMHAHVRAKAAQYGSTVVYKQDGELIEEDPRTAEKRVLKPCYNAH